MSASSAAAAVSIPFTERVDIRELREAIIDHEHALEWNEALTCYEQLLDRVNREGVRFTRVVIPSSQSDEDTNGDITMGVLGDEDDEGDEDEDEDSRHRRDRMSVEERTKVEIEKEIYLGIMKTL